MSRDTTLQEWDVAGLIRRVRRVCDLSQADLAGRLGVAQSTVARWELGQREPSLGQFRALVKLARWQLRVCAADGAAVRPMDADGPRDRRNRRVPAHLELVPFWPYAPRPTRCAEQHWFVPKRRVRDAWRKHCYGGRAPKDHLTEDHVRALVAVAVAARRRYYRAFWEQSIAAAVARGRPDPREPPPVCTCPIECEDVPGCIAGCECLCEVVEIEPGTSESAARALAISASMRSCDVV